MSTLIITLFIFFTIINVFLVLSIRSSRKTLKIMFTEKNRIPSQALKILYDLSKDDPWIKDYIVNNASIFLYPFAAKIISPIGGWVQILSVLIFIFSIFKFNLIFLVLAVVFFFLSGYTASRFNKKTIFNQAVKNFTSQTLSIPSSPTHRNLRESTFKKKLSDFHEIYYQELKKDLAKR